MFCFQTPFQRLVKRMTRFNSKVDVETTVKRLRSVLDKRSYQFKITNSKVVQYIKLHYIKFYSVRVSAIPEEMANNLQCNSNATINFSLNRSVYPLLTEDEILWRSRPA